MTTATSGASPTSVVCTTNWNTMSVLMVSRSGRRSANADATHTNPLLIAK
jgi:hypothetical protein